MDRMTKATLWVAFLVLGSYFVWFFLDCAMDDDTCHLICTYGSRSGCHIQRAPKAIIEGRLTHELKSGIRAAFSLGASSG
jgi:hypothetical protein